MINHRGTRGETVIHDFRIIQQAGQRYAEGVALCVSIGMASMGGSMKSVSTMQVERTVEHTGFASAKPCDSKTFSCGAQALPSAMERLALPLGLPRRLQHGGYCVIMP